MTTHDLKTWPIFYEALTSGAKTFEIRWNDRGFQVGDTLRLREWDQNMGAYTGRSCTRVVTYLTSFAQQGAYVVLGLQDPDA